MWLRVPPHNQQPSFFRGSMLEAEEMNAVTSYTQWVLEKATKEAEAEERKEKAQVIVEMVEVKAAQGREDSSAPAVFERIASSDISAGKRKRSQRPSAISANSSFSGSGEKDLVAGDVDDDDDDDDDDEEFDEEDEHQSDVDESLSGEEAEDGEEDSEGGGGSDDQNDADEEGDEEGDFDDDSDADADGGGTGSAAPGAQTESDDDGPSCAKRAKSS